MAYNRNFIETFLSFVICQILRGLNVQTIGPSLKNIRPINSKKFAQEGPCHLNHVKFLCGNNCLISFHAIKMSKNCSSFAIFARNRNSQIGSSKIQIHLLMLQIDKIICHQAPEGAVRS